MIYKQKSLILNIQCTVKARAKGQIYDGSISQNTLHGRYIDTMCKGLYFLQKVHNIMAVLLCYVHV